MLRSTVLLVAALGSAHAVDIAKGEAVFKQLCVTCHGEDLGGGIGPSLVDAYWKHGDAREAVFKTITEGVYDSNMIAFGAIISEEDRWNVVEYIRMHQQPGLRQVELLSYATAKLAEGDSLTQDFSQAQPYALSARNRIQTHLRSSTYFVTLPNTVSANRSPCATQAHRSTAADQAGRWSCVSIRAFRPIGL